MNLKKEQSHELTRSHETPISLTRVICSCARYIGDRLEIYIGPEMQEQIWGVLCGSMLPNHLRDLVIPHDRLRIRFVSDNVTSATELGFRIIYAFQMTPFSISRYPSIAKNRSRALMEKETMRKPISVAVKNNTYSELFRRYFSRNICSV